MKYLTRFLSVLFSGFLLTGCVSIGNSNLADEGKLTQIKVGETTKQQVVALLGEPSSRRSIEQGPPNREWWTYRYATSIINPLEYLLLYGFLSNGFGLFDVEHDLLVSFDTTGTVRSLFHQMTSFDMGSAFRPIQVTSTATYANATAGRPDKPVGFASKMEYRY